MNKYSEDILPVDFSTLRETARQIRLLDLDTVYNAGAGHIGGEMSAIDILTTLYFRTLRIDPLNTKSNSRDRFILSKGHTACALYVTLAMRGYFPVDELSTFLKQYSALNGHPNCVKVPGVETNTGPLGHGLPVAVGMALAAKMSGSDWRVFVLCGDGEMQEGSNWEAIMTAAQYKLDNLVLIVDHNRLQQGATVGETIAIAPISEKTSAFGWASVNVDGHDYEQLAESFDSSNVVKDKPKCIVAHTSKGQGISFMKDRVEWHHKVPNEEQYKQARKELEQSAA
ncbi:MAG: transketolase [Gammaproteobacteria bacterium]|nr:transketolase [Gammaproteobacteria bacterium]